MDNRKQGSTRNKYLIGNRQVGGCAEESDVGQGLCLSMCQQSVQHNVILIQSKAYGSTEINNKGQTTQIYFAVTDTSQRT